MQTLAQGDSQGLPNPKKVTQLRIIRDTDGRIIDENEGHTIIAEHWKVPADVRRAMIERELTRIRNHP